MGLLEAVIARLELAQGRWVRQEISRIDREFRRSTRVPETREELMAELATRQDVTMDQVLAVGRMPDGKLVWLEEGDADRGFTHVMRKFIDFAGRGISEQDISDFLLYAATHGRFLGVQGRDRKVFEVFWQGQNRYVSISISDNGYIIGANPTPSKLIRRLTNND